MSIKTISFSGFLSLILLANSVFAQEQTATDVAVNFIRSGDGIGYRTKRDPAIVTVRNIQHQARSLHGEWTPGI